MTALQRGLLVAVIQVALMAAVAVKLAYDRATLPRAWIESAGVDPDLPIRGRYVALGLLFPPAPESAGLRGEDGHAFGRVEVRDGRAVAVIAADGTSARPGRELHFIERRSGDDLRWMLAEPVAFFLPEDAPDPTLGVRPGDLWVEATMPPRSAPRPIRLRLEGDAP
jgi:hypothetical protein